MIFRRFIVLVGFVVATELHAQSVISVENRASEIGSDLDKTVNQLLSPSLEWGTDFDVLKKEISQVFFSTPTIMQLVAILAWRTALKVSI